MSIKSITLLFYGVGVSLSSSQEDVLSGIRHDFSYFEKPIKNCQIKIVYHRQKPDYDDLPLMESFLATPRNICYRDKQKTYIDYFGKALNIYDKDENSCRIYTENKDLAREIIYLTILSRVCGILDSKGIHRIHALGLEYNNQAILVLLPSGGGKTTLAMGILESGNSKMRLLSED